MPSIIRRSGRILWLLLLWLLGLVLALWLLLQLPSVQTWLVRQATHRLGKSLGTTVQVKRVDIGLLNRVSLKGVLVLDQQKDTLASIGEARIKASDWFFRTNTVTLTHVGLSHVLVHLKRTNKVWNYQFIADYFGGSNTGKKPKSKKKAPMQLRLESADIDHLAFIQADHWKGNVLVASIGKLGMVANKVDFSAGIFDIDKLVLDKAEYHQLKKSGLWSREDSIANRRRLDSLRRLKTYPEHWNTANLQLRVRKIDLTNSVLEIFNRHNRPFVRGEFDERDIIIGQLNAQLRDLRLDADTITASVNLKAKERSGFVIHKLNTRFRMHPQLMEFAALSLHTNESKLGPYYAMRYRSLDDMEDFIDSVRIEARFKDAIVSMADIAVFAPALKGITQQATITGNAQGTVSDFLVQGLDLRTGRSRLTGTYSMKGLIAIDKTQISFDTRGSVVDLKDVEVWAPQLKKMRNTPVSNLGLVYYKGTFEGTYQDFVANGNITTDVGNMDARLAMYLGPRKSGRQAYSGTVKNARIHAGKLLNLTDLGMVSFDGTVSSATLGTETPLMFSGRIGEGTYKGYTYRDVGIDGRFSNTGLSADINANDPNLNASITTFIDFRNRKQRYNARGAIGFADLRRLNFTRDSLQVAGLFDVDFAGNQIDDFLGYAKVYDAEINDGRRSLQVDSFVARSAVDAAGIKSLSVKTDEADVQVSGRFKLSELPGSFQHFLHGYYPSIIDNPRNTPRDQEMTFNVVTKNVEPLMYFFDPSITGLGNASIIGDLNTNVRSFNMEARVPYFAYDGITLTNTDLQARGSGTTLVLSGRMADVRVTDSLSFPGANILINTANDTTAISVSARGKGMMGDVALNGRVYSKPGGFEVDLDESTFILNNRKWAIQKDGMLSVNNGYLVAENVQLSSDEQKIRLVTQPSEEGNWNDAYLSFEQFSLGNVLPLFFTSPRLEGLLNGSAVIQNPTGKGIVTADAAISQFYFNDDSIGLVKLQGKYDIGEMLLQSTLESRNPLYDFGAQVKVNLNDSVKQQMDSRIQLRNEKLSLLKPYLTSVFDHIDGQANGEIRLVGKLSAPEMIGRVTISQASLKVGINQCTYYIDSADIGFEDGLMDFGKMRLKDWKGRKATFSGKLYHRFFDNMAFNMNVETDSLQVLNTVAKDNDLFYGEAVARASMDITGPLNNMNIRISGTTTDSSHIVIANKQSKETSQADYIVYKTYGKQLEEVVDSAGANYHLRLDLTATPVCRIDVVVDEIAGDVIKANGTGNIKIETGTLEPTTMRGRFTIEKGSYNYSFQTVIRRPFDLLGGDNSYIEWNGDPYEANLNLVAQYTARGVSLRDLMASEQGRTILDQSAQNYKGDVFVKAIIKGKLSTPDIQFAIEFPPSSPMRNNVSALEMLRSIEQDNSEMLRQVTYLIVFRSFAPYKEGVGVRNPGADLAVNTLSDLLSTQMGKILTNVVQQITGDRSLNVDITTDFYSSAELVGGNVSTAAGYDRVNFNFMVNKSFFNNRVVVNLGSDFDVGVTSSTAGFQFLPDVSVEFILTQNRRLRAIVFKKDNLDLSGRLNRQGLSFSYRKEYDKFISSNPEEAFIFTRRNAGQTKKQR